MKFIFTLLLLSLFSLAHAQVDIYYKDLIPNQIRSMIPDDVWERLPDSIVYMPVRDAARVEYWAQKGVASVELIAALEHELELMDKELDFQVKILANCQAYQEEYRQKLEHVSVMYNNKASDYIKLEIVAKEWEKKAKNRGTTIWAIGGAAALLLFGIALGI